MLDQAGVGWTRQPGAGPGRAYMQEGLVPKQVAISASPQNLSNFCPQGTLL